MKYVHILTFRIDPTHSIYPSYIEIRVKLDTKFMPYAEYVNIRNRVKKAYDEVGYKKYWIILIEHMISTLEDEEKIPNDKTDFGDLLS